jgi:hypothetical protein
MGQADLLIGGLLVAVVGLVLVTMVAVGLAAHECRKRGFAARSR